MESPHTALLELHNRVELDVRTRLEIDCKRVFRRKLVGPQDRRTGLLIAAETIRPWARRISQFWSCLVERTGI